MAPLIIAVVLAIFAIVLVASAVRIVRQSHVGMIERFGKYRATLSPGLHIVIPFFDRMRVVVDMRETVQPFAPQPVITEDNVTIAIDTVVYFQVTDAFRATYEVANFLTAMEQLAQTTLRNLVGAMTLEETLTSRDQINTQLREVLDEATEKWGVRVTRVELKSIDPPRSIQEAMEQQMRADRAKRATILQAEGEKQSADPARRGRAPGRHPRRRGRPAVADPPGRGRPPVAGAAGRGEAEALEHVFDMVKKAEILPSDMLGYKYLEALPAVAAGDANKLLLLPSGASGRHGRRCRSGRRIRPGRGSGQGSGAAAADAPPAPRGRASAGRGAAASRAPQDKDRWPLQPATTACRILAPTARWTHSYQEDRDPDAKSPAGDAHCNPGGDPYEPPARRLRAGRHRDARGARLAERHGDRRHLPRHPRRHHHDLRAGRRLPALLVDPLPRPAGRPRPAADRTARPSSSWAGRSCRS